MKIISTYHDYYDHAMAYGQDQTIVYNRKQDKFEIERVVPSNLNSFIKIKTKDENIDVAKLSEVANRISDCLPEKTFVSLGYNQDIKSKNNDYKLKSFSIVFCGKLYRAITVQKFNHSYTEIEIHTFYSYDSIIAYLEKEKAGLEKENRWVKRTIRDKIRKEFEIKHEIDVDYLIENKVTCVKLDSRDIEINPVLKDIDFYKVFDPFSCYQELDMWISGTLSYPQNFMVEIEDKYRIEQHGFDPKYGFRKRPKVKK